MHAIDRYKNRHRVTDEELASAVGISVHYLRKIRYGERIPTRNVAVRISAATGGEITIEQLLFPDGVPNRASLSGPLAEVV